MARNLHILSSAETAAQTFVEFILENAPNRHKYTVALSGGSTAKILFDIMSQKKFADRFDWDRIHFFWVDDRMVPPTDEESNYGVAKALFLDKVSVPEANVHRIFGEDDPQEEANRYSKEVKKLLEKENGLPRFDLIILGMGEDGHTASIFPDQIELMAAHEIAAVATHPDSGQKRITLTGPVINNAAYVAYMVMGKNKAKIVAEIIHQRGDFQSYPAAHILPITGQLHWFLDTAAASKLAF